MNSPVYYKSRPPLFGRGEELVDGQSVGTSLPPKGGRGIKKLGSMHKSSKNKSGKRITANRESFFFSPLIRFSLARGRDKKKTSERKTGKKLLKGSKEKENHSSQNKSFRNYYGCISQLISWGSYNTAWVLFLKYMRGCLYKND
uniref:hypothetical protein n=1 Tax=Cephaleuros parasiticus TaxID=173370 RepID=UPI001EE02AE3|nr:hypothetical protein MFQ79_pgp093 [Cephaleuros parasiticus]UIB38969.1 hypothetical protein [Cephaleuros parasiticus]